MKNLRSSYKEYKQESKKPVDIKTYLNITTGFIKFLMFKVLNGDEVVLPWRLGTLMITGRKQKLRIENDVIKGLSPNWKKTKELWEKSEEARLAKRLVYNTNEHSESYRYKFIWSKKRSIVENKTLYSLIFTRANKRELASRILEGKEYYTV